MLAMTTNVYGTLGTPIVKEKDRSIATSTILQAEGLRFAYPQRALFSNWSARITPGLTLLRGDDGSGKTTLLRLLAGELAADAGTLSVNGIRLSAQPDAYRRQVFWLDPRTTQFDQITALDYFASLRPRYPALDAALLSELAESLGLTPHLAKPLYMLSTGSKRKVWLAAAFASGAALTLLDEPFAALDKGSINFVLDLLADAALSERAWVMAHYEAPGDVVLAQVIELGS
jgi:ABC-type multidrug transport system ATPase subunit